MIKWIKSLIEKVFGKFCKCEEPIILEDEEKYLLRISDRDARDGETMLNFTEYPTIILEKWLFDVQSTARYAYINKWGLDHYYNLILNSPKFRYLTEDDDQFRVMDTGYFAGPARQHPTQSDRVNGRNRRTILF